MEDKECWTKIDIHDKCFDSVCIEEVCDLLEEHNRAGQPVRKLSNGLWTEFDAVECLIRFCRSVFSGLKEKDILMSAIDRLGLKIYTNNDSYIEFEPSFNHGMLSVDFDEQGNITSLDMCD